MPSRVNQILLAETKSLLDGDANVVLVGYRGLTAAQADQIRSGLQDRGVTLRIVRNRLARRALAELDKPDLSDLFDGPTAVMEGGDDPILVAKAAAACAKEIEAFAVRGGLLEGKKVTAAEVEQWAAMPSREELLAMVLGQIVGVAGGVIAAITSPAGAVASQIEKIAERDEESDEPDKSDETAA